MFVSVLALLFSPSFPERQGRGRNGYSNLMNTVISDICSENEGNRLGLLDIRRMWVNL